MRLQRLSKIIQCTWLPPNLIVQADFTASKPHHAYYSGDRSDLRTRDVTTCRLASSARLAVSVPMRHRLAHREVTAEVDNLSTRTRCKPGFLQMLPRQGVGLHCVDRRGRVLATRGRRNAATPVIVRKGALADNVPFRDLHVTKAHALYIDDVLIPVEFLVNHRSCGTSWCARALASGSLRRPTIL
jgi:hypothetical protein